MKTLLSTRLALAGTLALFTHTARAQTWLQTGALLGECERHFGRWEQIGRRGLCRADLPVNQFGSNVDPDQRAQCGVVLSWVLGGWRHADRRSGWEH
jgi:hypothetical protein